MNLTGIEKKGNPDFKYQYNEGTEREEAFGLNWDQTDFRSYDAQLGRFISIDPVAEIDFDWTPYRFAYNNPLIFNDPLGLWEKTANGWRTSDTEEISQFLTAWKDAGKNPEVLDGKAGNEEQELFRVFGDGRTVSIFYGEQRKESNAKFKINSTPHPDGLNSILEEVPYVGSAYKSSNRFSQGEYGWGLFHAGMFALDATSLGLTNSAKAGLSSTSSKVYTVYETQRDFKKLAGVVSEPLPYFGITTNGINRYSIGTIQRTYFQAQFVGLGKNTARGIEQALINLNNQGHYSPFSSKLIDNLRNSTSPLRIFMYNYRLRLGTKYLNTHMPNWKTYYLR